VAIRHPLPARPRWVGILWSDEKRQALVANSHDSIRAHGIGNNPPNPSTLPSPSMPPKNRPELDRFVPGTLEDAANCRRVIRTIRRNIHETLLFSIV
jgi:hypothetical protein